IVLMPIYTHKIPIFHQQLWLYFLIPFLLKGWNLHSHWNALQIQDRQHVFRHTLSRFLITFAVLYLFFSGGTINGYSVWIIALPLISVAFIWVYIKEKRWQEKESLNWLV